MYEEQPSSSRPLRVALLVLFFVLLAALVLVILTQKGLLGKKTGTTIQSQTGTTTPTGNQRQATSGEAVPAATSQPVFSEEVQNQFKAIQDQVNAGTITPEEASKQLNSLNIPPPPIPPEIQKQIDEATKAQQ
ncbi:MAG: hypothetical protein Q7S04_00090 [Candidatus Moranbacteria bacterium]|nr:hypothetical protein [Candidatus Moranbacteria bacterium]